MMEKITCSICGCPREVTYKEQDHETGRVKEIKHTVECGGHTGIHPCFWNKCNGNSSGGIRSLGYQDYKTFYDKLAKERPSVPVTDQEGIADIRVRQEKKRKERKARKDNTQRRWPKRVSKVRGRQSR